MGLGDNFLIGLIIVLVIVLIVCAYFYYQKKDETTTEAFGFGGLPSTSWVTDTVYADSQQAMNKGDFYAVPGTYQASLSPRFSNVDYGSHLLTKPPDRSHMASPLDPLTYRNPYANPKNLKNVVKEGYTSQPCGQGGAQLGASQYASIPFQQVKGNKFASNVGSDKKYNSLQAAESNIKMAYPEPTDMLPIGDMTTATAGGEINQPVVATRFYYANRNNRLRSLADPIRGDLPIAPCTATWFRPSVHPHIDLNPGAMNVMGGRDNETANAMSALINSVSGDTAIGGVDVAVEKSMTLGAGMADLEVYAY